MMAEAPKPPARRRRPRRSAVEWVRKTDFPAALRGYDRQAVDRYVAEVAQLVAELEATQTREGVVQRALDEVGEQTSGILQHAHDTAEEIAARSRSQAEGRLQRAEQEAEQTRQDADLYAHQVVDDTQRLWNDRQRLIEDLRHLADEVLGVSDDALERLELPNTSFMGGDAEVAGEGVVAEEPLGEEADVTAAWDMTAEEAPAEDDAGEGEQPEEDSGGGDGDEPTLDDADAEDATNEFEAPTAQKRGDS
jgi:DivIVA domain-containing protein